MWNIWSIALPQTLYLAWRGLALPLPKKVTTRSRPLRPRASALKLYTCDLQPHNHNQGVIQKLTYHIILISGSNPSLLLPL